MSISKWLRARAEKRRAEKMVWRKNYLIDAMEKADKTDNLGLLRRHLKALPRVRLLSTFSGGWSKVCVTIEMTDGFEIKVYELHEVNALRVAVGQVVTRLRELWEAEAAGG